MRWPEVIRHIERHDRSMHPVLCFEHLAYIAVVHTSPLPTVLGHLAQSPTYTIENRLVLSILRTFVYTITGTQSVRANLCGVRGPS